MTAENIPPRRARAPGQRQDLTTIVVPLETITPILGGAAVPRTLDDHDPVRVPGIRGQLRFWWRALYGHGHDPAALARREAELWGGVHGETPVRSRVAVWIAHTDLQKSRKDDENIGYSAPGSYALWPARATESDPDPAPRRTPGMRFEICLRAPVTLQEDILCTLRAWILFGGIGSRTRRGCGSVTIDGRQRESWLPVEPTAAELRRLLGQDVLRITSVKATDMPSLRGAALLHGKSASDSIQAWTQSIAWLHDFRQGSGPTDKYARGAKMDHRPGRSRWPEPDKVRHLSPLRAGQTWQHEPVYDHRPVWPRASFGLPINAKFQTKDRQRRRYPRPEPGRFELVWRDGLGLLRDRLASPLILKALPLANGTYVPIALWLDRAYPEGGEVGLKDGERLRRGSAAPFDRLHAQGDADLYQPLRGAQTMKEAFITWLEREKRLVRIGGEDI